MDYENLNESEALVTEKTGLAPSDLSTLLEASAGTKDGTTFYRPYYVCAVLLESNLHTRKLLKGEGAEFDDPSITVRGFLNLQHGIDQAEGLELPEGMKAIAVSRTRSARSTAVPTRSRW